MSSTGIFQSEHFDLHRLAEGVFAAIAKVGGAAYSNAGIIDLGGRTLVIDAFDTMLAGQDLRQAAEDLFSRRIDFLGLTHSHNDHWIGASSFDKETTLIASETIREETMKWGQILKEEIQKPAEWKQWVAEMEEQLQTEEDERVRVGLELSITRVRYFMKEMSRFKPRYAEQSFTDNISFQGNKRRVELKSFGAGHSSDDIVFQLPDEGIAFIGDIGFFHQQPFMGVCDLDHWRVQLKELLSSTFKTLVPGHGPLGGSEELKLQLEYFDLMEDLIEKEVQKGNPVKEVLQIGLPEPFAGWQVGGMGRFEVNVKYLYKRAGGEIPEEE